MVFCIFCNRKYKTKKAYKSHTDSQSHKDNEKIIKSDQVKFRKMFLTNFCSFVYRYDDYKMLDDVYRSYIKNDMIGYREVGYKDLDSFGKDLIDSLDIIRKNDKWYVKGYDRFVPSSKLNMVYEDSEELSLEESGDIEISTYEEYYGDFEGLEEFILSKISDL